MNSDKQNEELLREASAFGDEEGVRKLLDSGVDINCQHSVNGWTALHWAAKRGHTQLVHFLVSKNADTSLTSVYGETALSLASSDEICKVLSGNWIIIECIVILGNANYKSEIKEKCVLPITPNYFSNPVLAPKIVENGVKCSEDRHSNSVGENDSKRKLEEEMVLKVRIADSCDQDFIEVEVPQSEMTYENVFQVCCDELNVKSHNVLKLRKLPNTIVRKDKDVLRFQNFQELELVLKDSNSKSVQTLSESNP
ncbi:hypothetical protein JTE90_016664 [Oedothorax gibbosus]|uniref:Ankyrin repeat domain-containing protein 40 n=1 Tax=Oedothorax gibbosus TaxID=931172 RepID=A0AAV6V4B8_9ARAC|nr:hypothetical protein JTE90_016664 [Oedothorax gibbosus]